MKTKLEMAMQMIVAEVRRVGITSIDNDKVIDAWNLADAMQAEAEKREKKEQSEHVFEAIEEWQPDWSQAPEHANTWQKSSANNYYWCCDDDCLGAAPSFGYTGDWRNSLRKRPK